MEKVAQFIKLNSPERKLPLLCKWTEKHYEEGRTVAIHAADDDQAKKIDKKLWTFSQSSFVPHVILIEGEDAAEPVLIAVGDQEVPDSDVLMVASGRDPDGWMGRFERVYDFAEIYDSDLRLAARKRFKAYQDGGYSMKFIE